MNRNLLTIAGVLLAVLAAGAGGFLASSMLRPAEAAEAHAAAVAPTAPEAEAGLIFALKERVLNLADKGTRRYIKLSVAIETPAPAELARLSGEEHSKRAAELQKEMGKFEPMLNDILTSLVTTRTAEQLSDLAGKDALKAELQTRFGEVLEGQRVTHIYFTEFLIQ